MLFALLTACTSVPSPEVGPGTGLVAEAPTPDAPAAIEVRFGSQSTEFDELGEALDYAGSLHTVVLPEGEFVLGEDLRLETWIVSDDGARLVVDGDVFVHGDVHLAGLELVADQVLVVAGGELTLDDAQLSTGQLVLDQASVLNAFGAELTETPLVLRGTATAWLESTDLLGGGAGVGVHLLDDYAFLDARGGSVAGWDVGVQIDNTGSYGEWSVELDLVDFEDNGLDLVQGSHPRQLGSDASVGCNFWRCSDDDGGW